RLSTLSNLLSTQHLVDYPCAQEAFHPRRSQQNASPREADRRRHRRAAPPMARSRVPLRARRRAGEARLGRVARAAGSASPGRDGGQADQRLPARTRADRLRVQGVRAGTGGLLRQARRQGDLLVLESGRGQDRALARAGSRLCRPAAGSRGREGVDMRGLWLLVHVLGFTLWLCGGIATMVARSEEHTSELQSRGHLVCSLLL